MDLEALMVARANEQIEAGAWKRGEDADEGEPRPFLKEHAPAPGRCAAWGCHRNARARGLCDTHYRIARRGDLTQAEFRKRRQQERAA